MLVAIAAMAVLAAPALAHGDHDARPLARNLEAGPYTVSLWQVYPDAGTAMAPHLIVMFDGGVALAPTAELTVAVDSVPVEVVPSTTSTNGWESADGLAEGAVVEVTIIDESQSWALDPVVVPPAATSVLPMQELLYTSIALTAATTWWVARRTARAWRRPVVAPA